MTASRRRVFGRISIIFALMLAIVLGIRGKQLDDTSGETSVPTAAEVQPSVPTTLPQREFTEAELVSALAVVCSDAGLASATKEWTQVNIEARIDAFNYLKRGLSEGLSASSSVEHIHLTAMLEDDAAVRVELIDRALSVDPSDPFLLWGAVQICSESGNSVHCPLRDWEQRLIAVDNQNSESWVRIAVNRYAEGENDAALEAMRHASTAAEARVYWTETVEMIERGFAAGSDSGFPERAAMAFSFAASALPRYGDYVNMCREQSSESVNWAYACLAYGELVERQGKTEMGVSMARVIQKLALEALGEPEKAAQVEERIQARRQDRLNSANSYSPAASERVIFSNPTFFSAYLAAIRSEGEEAARRRIGAEIEWLIQQQPGLSCE